MAGLTLLLLGWMGGAPRPRDTAAAAADAPGNAAPPRVLPGELLVAASGPLEGSLEPCGCAEGQQGGLARRGSLLGRWRRSGLAPLALDLGDIVLPTDTDPRALELRAETALEALGRLQVRAAAVGELDLRLGAQALRRLGRSAGVELLAANLVGLDGSRPFRAALDLDGARVTAVLDPGLAGGGLGGVRATDPRAAVALALAGRDASVRGIVLFHGSAAAAERALAGLSGVDLVIAGHDEAARALRPRALAGGATLVEVEAKGQRLWAVPLGPPGASAARTVAVRLDGLLPDDARARDRIDAFYVRATELGLSLPKRRPPDEGGELVGTRVCAGCHPREAELHAATPHAHALERLKAQDPARAGLPECLRCHTTGLGLESGYDPRVPAAGLAHVSCEACHGVGSSHAGGPVKRGYGRPYAALSGWRERCVQCHDRGNSPRFDLDTYLKRIKHWSDTRR